MLTNAELIAAVRGFLDCLELAPVATEGMALHKVPGWLSELAERLEAESAEGSRWRDDFLRAHKRAEAAEREVERLKEDLGETRRRESQRRREEQAGLRAEVERLVAVIARGEALKPPPPIMLCPNCPNAAALREPRS